MHYCDVAVFTDNNLVDVHSSDAKHKIARLLESPVLFPEPYKHIRRLYGHFKHVLTFDQETLQALPNAVMCHAGGCWIQEPRIAAKSKLISIILSDKKSSKGHMLRHDIVKNLPQVDAFGRGTSKPLPHLEKHLGLNDYRYSIVVENCRRDYYFTEKLIDCFATGTIPIYWGCPDIEEIFSSAGMIRFKTLGELKSILNSLSAEDYEDRLPAIKENFERSRKYWVPDDWVWERVLQPLVEV